jgi:hypothetical protein
VRDSKPGAGVRLNKVSSSCGTAVLPKSGSSTATESNQTETFKFFISYRPDDATQYQFDRFFLYAVSEALAVDVQKRAQKEVTTMATTHKAETERLDLKLRNLVTLQNQLHQIPNLKGRRLLEGSYLRGTRTVTTTESEQYPSLTLAQQRSRNGSKTRNSKEHPKWPGLTIAQGAIRLGAATKKSTIQATMPDKTVEEASSIRRVRSMLQLRRQAYS